MLFAMLFSTLTKLWVMGLAVLVIRHAVFAPPDGQAKT
jgi:hypothetical protein